MIKNYAKRVAEEISWAMKNGVVTKSLIIGAPFVLPAAAVLSNDYKTFLEYLGLGYLAVSGTIYKAEIDSAKVYEEYWGKKLKEPLGDDAESGSSPF